MKIVRVQVLEFHRRLDGTAWNPTFRWNERRAPLLVIETDAGVAGVGEAWSRQAECAQVLDCLAEHWAPALLGNDPREPASLVTQLESAIPLTQTWVDAAAASAVDIALWDLAARAAGMPLWQALGGRSGRAAVYASGGLYRDGATLDDLAREFAGYADLGFNAMKMKIGALSFEADIERVRCVRAALGDRCVLWVDAVNQLTRELAPAWSEALAALGVAAIQAPLKADDLAGMAIVNQRMPVVANEAEFCEARFGELLDARSVGYLQFCLGLCGGFTAATRIDQNARAHAIKSTPQCFSTAILQAASLHFGAARENVAMVEYHRFHDHLSAALPAAMKSIQQGCVLLDDAPGLGVPPPSPGPQSGGGEVRSHRNVEVRHYARHG